MGTREVRGFSRKKITRKDTGSSNHEKGGKMSMAISGRSKDTLRTYTKIDTGKPEFPQKE